MSKKRFLIRGLLFTGVIATVLAWTIIGVSWVLNPWFVFTRDAFSDLGGPRSYYPCLYNYGLIIVGVVVLAWSISLYYVAQTKLEVIGAGYVFLMGIFLALIGVFPSGTRHHVFVSTWFFIQSDLAFIVLAMGMILRGSSIGKILFIISIMGFPIAALVEALVGWPSIATVEAYGIAIIDVGVFLTTIEYYKSSLTWKQ